MDPISTNFPFSMMKQHFQKGNKICLESMMAKFRTLFQSHFEEVIAKVVAQPLSARLIIKRSWVQIPAVCKLSLSPLRNVFLKRFFVKQNTFSLKLTRCCAAWSTTALICTEWVKYFETEKISPGFDVLY